MTDTALSIEENLFWECKATGKPKPSFSWLKNGEQLMAEVWMCVYVKDSEDEYEAALKHWLFFFCLMLSLFTNLMCKTSTKFWLHLTCIFHSFHFAYNLAHFTEASYGKLDLLMSESDSNCRKKIHRECAVHWHGSVRVPGQKWRLELSSLHLGSTCTTSSRTTVHEMKGALQWFVLS